MSRSPDPKAKEQIASGKPSAVIVVANWLGQQTHRDMRERLRVKWDLTRLYETGFKQKDVLKLYRLIDWLLSHPSDLVLPAGLGKHETGDPLN